MTALAEVEDVAQLIPDEMTIWAGALCLNPTEFNIRGTDLWVLLAEDDHFYERGCCAQLHVQPSREAALEAITAAIVALEGARDRLLVLPSLRERL